MEIEVDLRGPELQKAIQGYMGSVIDQYLQEQQLPLKLYKEMDISPLLPQPKSNVIDEWIYAKLQTCGQGLIAAQEFLGEMGEKYPTAAKVIDGVLTAWSYVDPVSWGLWGLDKMGVQDATRDQLMERFKALGLDKSATGLAFAMVGMAEVYAGKGKGSTVLEEAKTFIKIDFPRVQSRINIMKGDISKNGKGLERLWHKHNPLAPNDKSKFHITKEELVDILKDKSTVKTPIHLRSNDGGYVREVDVGRVIGVEAFKNEGLIRFKPTTKISIITDKYGNLTNAFPGKVKGEK